MALRHIVRCPDCQERFRQLWVELANEAEDNTIFCPYEPWLLEYMKMKAQGKAAEAFWREIADHLMTCDACAVLYADLTALQDQAERDAIPPDYPEPDLSFLYGEPKKATNLPPFWHMDTLGRLIVEFSDELLRRLQMPSYQAAAVGLKSIEVSRILFEVEVCEGQEDLDVTITAETSEEAQAFCTLIVEVRIPDRGGWPNLAGTLVTLKRDTETLAIRRTDAFGKAIFPHVPLHDLPKLNVEITPIRDRAPPSH